MSEFAQQGWSRIKVAAACLLAASAAHARGVQVSVPALPTAAPMSHGVSMPQLPSNAQLPNVNLLPIPTVQGVPVGQVPVSANASLNALAPQQIKADSPAQQPQQAQAAVYDGAKKAEAAQAAAPAVPSAGSYTSESPEIPLARLSPSWQPAEPAPASLKAIARRKPAKEPVDIGSEETYSAKDDIKMVSGTTPSSLSSRDEVSYFETKGFTVSGAKQMGMRGNSVLWIDEDGKLNAYDVSAKKTTRYTGPMGAIERFAVAQDGKLFVSGAGHVQRWDLESGDATVILDERFDTKGGVEIVTTPQGAEFVLASGRWAWSGDRLLQLAGAGETATPEPLTQAGGGSAWRASPTQTELWREGSAGWTAAAALPISGEAAAVSKDGGVAYVLSQGALYQWEVEGGRYRKLDVPGLSEAAVGPKPSVQTSEDGRFAVVTAGERFFVVDTQRQSAEVAGVEGRVRLWSEQNPMFVKDGLLHIGDFTFPIAKRYANDDRTPLRKFFDRVLRLSYVPAELPVSISEKNWKALNLPSNKYNLYQTLRSFSLGQHVMYVGETGGGKTWLADMIAQITNNELWMVSLTEYTRNQDLIARDTFGEEGANKTGLSMSVVLKWLQNGGVLLLDEMHKPLEGVAALNNILQNLEYRMPDGRVIKGDPKKCFVIGTMNPVKPPYKGEPPSGELESRFGTKLRVNYLPPAEEAALLRIFKPQLGEKMAASLIRIANELRKSYPDVLPLPISSRTLLHIVQEIAQYPNDDPVEIFKVKYNPMALLDDASIGHAIDKALQAHDLRGAASADVKKNSLNP